MTDLFCCRTPQKGENGQECGKRKGGGGGAERGIVLIAPPKTDKKKEKRDLVHSSAEVSKID